MPLTSPNSLDPVVKTSADQSYFRPWSPRDLHRSSSDNISPGTSPVSPSTSAARRVSLKLNRRQVQKPVVRSPPAYVYGVEGRPEHPSDGLTLKNGGYRSFLKAWSSLDTVFEPKSTFSEAQSIPDDTLPISVPKRLPSMTSASRNTFLSKKRSTILWNRQTSGRAKSTLLDSKAHCEDSDVKTSFEVLTIDGAAMGHFHSAEASAPAMHEYKEGLYCRVRRRLGLKHGRVENHTVTQNQGRKASDNASVLLRGAASILRGSTHDKLPRSIKSSSASTLSIAAVRHRKHGLFQQRDGESASSSVRSFFMGKPPASTPDASALYTGSDNEQYFRVDMSVPNSPSFLPSEARNVSTPPYTSISTSDERNRLRGFFSNYHSPNTDDTESLSWRELSSGRSKPSGDMTLGTKIDRLRARGFKTDIHHDIDFEIRVPEHLPGSPLCPINSKHGSGGKGMCPYHGRARTDSNHADEAVKKKLKIA
ncbi:accessory factor associated with RNA polymerase II [Ptychographa xylographoides]|nr:accessory factor associated with RNA polymerase II [Ptychographa xylographoides]